MAVDVRMSNFRLWMETRREHVYAGNSSNKKAIDTEVSSDMERLRSVRIHWDFWHKHDVHTKTFGPQNISNTPPLRWMEKTSYKRRLYPSAVWNLRYRPRFGGSMSWDADDPGSVEQPPTGKAILPRALGEWFDDNQMRRLSFTDMLRIHGISPVEVESVRRRSDGKVVPYEKWWTPAFVYYVEPVLPAKYLSKTAVDEVDYRIFVQFDVTVTTR